MSIYLIAFLLRAGLIVGAVGCILYAALWVVRKCRAADRPGIF